MSPQEEANAYQIVLNRPMEHGGSRRTGYKFIVDAQAEVQAQRQAFQNTITNQQNVINQLNATLAELRNLASQDALNDADVAARLDAAHARVADLTKQLEVMQVELAEATNNEPPAPKINPIIELLARLLRRNK